MTIYSEDSVKINERASFFDYFFPVEPLALFYP